MPEINYESLEFRNGYAYRRCKVPLRDQGLVLLRGVNLDDGGFLGAGKSSIFDVFAYMQTGHTGKRQRGDRHLANDIVNRNVGRDFEASLRLDIDGSPHEIIQCRKHRIHANKYVALDLNAGADMIPSDARKHPKTWVLTQLLQLDLNSFFSYIYMPQDMNNAMLSGTDNERQQRMMEMFELDIFDRLLAITDARLKLVRATLQDVEGLEEEAMNIRSELREHDDLPILESRAAAAREKAALLQEEHNHAVQQLETVQGHLRGMQERSRLVREATALWETYSDQIPADTVQKVRPETVEAIRQRMREIDGSIAQWSALRDQAQRRKIIETRLAEMGDAEEGAEHQLQQTRDRLSYLQYQELPAAEQRAEAHDDIAKVPPEVRKRLGERDGLARRSRELSRSEGRIEARLEEIKIHLEQGVCPTCKQPIRGTKKDIAAMRSEQQGLRSELEGVVQERRDTDRVLGQLNAYRDAKSRLAALPEARSEVEIQQEMAQLRRSEKKLQAALSVQQQRGKLEAQLAAIPAESQSPELLDRIAAAERERAEIEAVHVAVVNILNYIQRIVQLPKGDVGKLQERVGRRTREVRELGPRIARASTAASEIEAERRHVADLEQRRATIENGLTERRQMVNRSRYLDALKYCFGRQGLKLDRFRAILQDATQTTVPVYTDMFWPRRNVMLDLVEQGTSVKFELQRIDGPSVDSRLLSGGERTKAGMAILFGLRDLKERYTGTRSNLLVIDEPSNNMDPMGISRLMQVLQALKEKFATIIVIGNQNDIIGSRGWDQVWWAVRENNEATLYRNGAPPRAVDAAARFEF